MTAWSQGVGVLIEVIGTSVTTLGLNLMKLTSRKKGSVEGADDGVNWKWLLAFLVFVVGQLLESTALYFCTQTVMATASNFAFVANALCAWGLFGERFTKTDLFGSFCMIIGTVVVLFSAPTPMDANYTMDQLKDLIFKTGFVVAMSFQLGTTLLCLSYILVIRRIQDAGTTTRVVNNMPALAFGVMSSCLASMTITFSKIILLIVKSSIETSDGKGQFLSIGPYLYIATWGFFQVMTVVSLNEGMRQYDSLLVVPVYTVGRTLLVVISGLSLYQLWGHFDPVGGICFALGLMTCVISVMALENERQGDQRRRQARMMTQYWNVAFDEDDEDGGQDPFHEADGVAEDEEDGEEIDDDDVEDGLRMREMKDDRDDDELGSPSEGAGARYDTSPTSEDRNEIRTTLREI